MFEQEIKEQVMTVALKDSKLLQIVNESDIVGYSFDVNYRKVSFLTNDFWKMGANGIPHNSFLIATPFRKQAFIEANDIDKEVILLRVLSECKVPDDDLWIKTRVDKIKSLQDLDQDAPENRSLNYDDYSKKEMGFTGLECRVLGTFYEENGELFFGADLENYYGQKSLYIYKPKGESLQKIVNFIDPIRKKTIVEELIRNGIHVQNYDDLEQYEIGNIRYTSTNRMQSQSADVKVYVNPFDFIARRTATFGMTRTGKSNTVKTLIKAINKSCESHGLKVSQIVFDINGEYAFPNVQDGNLEKKISISNDIPNSIVYTLNQKVAESDVVKRLKFNFYKNLVLAHEFIVSLLESSSKNSSNDIEAFMNMDVSMWEDPEVDYNLKNRFAINKTLYQYLLYLCNCTSRDLKLQVPFSKTSLEKTQKSINEMLKEIEDQSVGKKVSKEIREYEKYDSWLSNIISLLTEKKYLPMEEFGQILKQLDEINRKVGIQSSSGGDLIRDETATLMNLIHQKNSNNQPYLGFRTIAKLGLDAYHENSLNKDYVARILEDMRAGRVIILDISNGKKDVRDRITKKIVEKIFNNNLDVFTSGDIPPKVILYVEEAHNLIGKEMELTDIWPRTAKEGAKYGIGLVYSTQEPSSINKNILSNTENWFVTHLNNEDEIKTLAKFYDFGDFKDSLLRAKDVGFARIKTMSQNFVVPVQIKKFEGDS
ncbi:ATP-binding protein [Lihuaxuella thermophila]|uniref:Helicase HerA central domain-containing protein n=1 Tax=Lihuaxuella thermophila TaxID=1173111 RepID=A0A1H8FPX4_9BACL|nr:DUF87 domain-containing protein [Lihuaxuella thermophila]SEN33640.1 protein of unknown function DUF87 [Lihuaxuella thermophila]